MSIEPHPQPGVKVRKDLNSYRLKQDVQDYQDGQDEEAIARACPSPAPKKTHPGARRARACPSQAPQPPMDKLRSSRTLSSCFLLML